jgi:outer membrane receptor protein involved in Fe transport
LRADVALVILATGRGASHRTESPLPEPLWWRSRSRSPGQATKIGFRPSLKTVVVRPSEELTVPFALDRTGQELERVIVRTDSAVDLRSDPTGFDLRRRGGLGTFITSDQIDARHAMETGQLFYGIAGVEVDRNGVVGIARGVISVHGACAGAQVFVDGVAMRPGAFSVNDVSIASIRGIEIYHGPATTPMQLRSSKTVCGTVAIWTK